jgi:hypothetical protein
MPDEDQLTTHASSSNAAPYRTVSLEKPPQEGDLWAWVAAGWGIACSACGATLGRLFIPFSGGYILSGSTSRLDSRLVERPTPETKSGHSYRRYGPPVRTFGKGKRARLAFDDRPGLSINGPFWVNCYACNVGQALEPERIGQQASAGRD